MLKLVSTPDLVHQYQVVLDDGLPDITLSVFASELMKSLSPGSVPVYMREVLALFNWALGDAMVQGHQWWMLGPVVEVRNIIREYLAVAAKCKLTYRADRTGMKATYVSETQETRINVRILLAALRRFYDHLISSKTYEPPNPLLHAEMGWVTQELRAQYRRAVREIEGRDPMPAVSGVDPPSGIRLSANFFRCVDREWLPGTIDDPDFPHLIYKAGKEFGWDLRELCVATADPSNGTAVARANSGLRRRQVQQAPDGANVGTDLIRRYISFIAALPIEKQCFDHFLAVRITNGLHGRAPA